MKLFTQQQLERLLDNGRKNAEAIALDGHTQDFFPVVKLFLPGSNAVWLLSEIDPDDHETAFGLCDLGAGFPELGSVWLPELQTVKNRFGLSVERDRYWKARHRLSSYTEAARQAGYIVDLP